MHESGKDWIYLWNSMWTVIITMGTVGYGDFVPKTHLGRCIAILACVWGNILISLMVISITVSSEFTEPFHRKAYEAILSKQETTQLRDRGARVLQALFRYLQAVNARGLYGDEKLVYLNQLRERLKQFQSIRKAVYSKEFELPMESQLLRLNTQVTYELDDLLRHGRDAQKSCLEQAIQCIERTCEQERRLSELVAQSNRLLKKLRLECAS
jgi:hypothetical protein